MSGPTQSTEVPEEAVGDAATAILEKAWGRSRLDDAGIPHTLYGHPMPAERSHAEKTAQVALDAAAPALLKQGAEEERGRLKEALFSRDAIDDGDGALMVRSEVGDCFVPDFESGLKTAWKTALDNQESS